MYAVGSQLVPLWWGWTRLDASPNMERFRELLRDKAEILADTAELVATLAGVILVLQHTQHGGHSQVDAAEWIQQLQLVSQDFTSTVESLLESTPVGSMLASAALAAMNAVRRNSEVVSLNEDEALLYARVFHEKGWRMPLFRKLLKLGGCHWGHLSGGRSRKLCRTVWELWLLSSETPVAPPPIPGGSGQVAI